MQEAKKLVKLRDGFMKIGIYDPYLDDLGGGEKYMMTIAECLAQKHDVSVFWDNVEDVKAIQKRFSLDLENVTLSRNIFAPGFGTIKRLKESKKYDIIIILSDGSIPVVASKKLFLHIQQPLLIDKPLSAKTKLKLKLVKKIFYNSQFTKSYNAKLFPSVPSTIIYPPVQLFPDESKKENIILHVGRFRVIDGKHDDYKKQQFMVKAFKEMVDNGLTDWKLYIATSVHDPHEPQFQEMLKSAEKYPITFAINKTNKELWELYNKAKIYWHASGFGEDLQKNPHLAEHFGISTLEAMGAGAVPVAINAGGQKEIITDGEDGLLWDTVEELQTKTKQLMNNNAQREELAVHARERAKDFTKELFYDAVNALVSSSQ